MNIFIAADDNYIYPARVMLTSFFLNNSGEKHKIYFMYSSVKDENIQLLSELTEAHGADFVPVKINSDDFQSLRRTERITVETYYRFLIPHVLPKSEARAIWLDVDLVVNGPLDDFYYQDFDGNCLAGCRDIGDHREKMLRLGCPSTCTYINAGVILFNMEKMRQYTLRDFCDYYITHEKEITWFDQDVINGMFAGRIKVWDCDKCNVQAYNWRFKNQYDLSKAVVVHYIGEGKPWMKTYSNDAAKVWDLYYSKTFKCHKNYLQRQKRHRRIEKYILIPFGECLRNLYAKSKVMRTVRNFIKRNQC